MNVLGLTITVSGPTSAYRWTKVTVALLVAGVVTLASGVAYAVWSTTGTGTGAAASGSSLGLTFSPGTVNGNSLYPTATGDVVITISNPNPFAVSVDSITFPATAASAYTDAGLTTANTTCNTNGTGVTWSYATKSMSGVIVAKKTGSTNGTLTLTLTGGASMSNSSDNSCQSSYFKMPAVSSVSGSSSTGTPVSSISQ